MTLPILLTRVVQNGYTDNDLLPVCWIVGSLTPPGGCFFAMRTIVLVDGQNLYHLAKAAWGPGGNYDWPSYDVDKLARTLVGLQSGRTLQEIRFYTGVPDQRASALWNAFWRNKTAYLRRQGISVYLGTISAGGQEKGVDVSLALDLVQATHDQAYDAAIIVSQDADFGPAVGLAKRVAHSQNRQLIFESAFPYAAGKVAPRGVPGTTWVRIDQAIYDSCFDPRNYRPRKT